MTNPLRLHGTSRIDPHHAPAALMLSFNRPLTDNELRNVHDLVSAATQPAPGMAVTALVAEIVEALLADEKDGGYDLTAGMFGAKFSALVRRWAALEYAAQAEGAETAAKAVGDFDLIGDDGGFTKCVAVRSRKTGHEQCVYESDDPFMFAFLAALTAAPEKLEPEKAKCSCPIPGRPATCQQKHALRLCLEAELNQPKHGPVWVNGALVCCIDYDREPCPHDPARRCAACPGGSTAAPAPHQQAAQPERDPGRLSVLGQRLEQAAESANPTGEKLRFQFHSDPESGEVLSGSSPQQAVQGGERPKEGGHSYEASMLRSLLARIHGDGGHYVAEHGLDATLEAAERLVADWRADHDRARAELALIRAALGRAASDVLAERQRQINVEGHTHEHDDHLSEGSLALAAASYAWIAAYAQHENPPLPPALWPWAAEWWKPTTPRRDLVKATALLLAEIERRDRRDEG